MTYFFTTIPGDYYVIADNGVSQFAPSDIFMITNPNPPTPPIVQDLEISLLEAIPFLEPQGEPGGYYTLYNGNGDYLSRDSIGFDLNPMADYLNLDVEGVYPFYISQTNEWGCEGNPSEFILTISNDLSKIEMLRNGNYDHIGKWSQVIVIGKVTYPNEGFLAWWIVIVGGLLIFGFGFYRFKRS